MRQRLREVALELRVTLHDTDALPLVWHGRSCEYLEPARTKLLRPCAP